MFGAHNSLNALAVIAVACEMGLSDDVIKRALAGFEGVKRRFTKLERSTAFLSSTIMAIIPRKSRPL